MRGNREREKGESVGERDLGKRQERKVRGGAGEVRRQGECRK